MNYMRIVCEDRIKLGNAAGGSLVLVSIAGAASRWATVAIGALSLLVGGLFLTGCASDRQASSPRTHTASKSDSDRTNPVLAAGITPEKVKAALPELEQLAKEALKKPGVPGLAIAVVYQDRVVYARGFGVREAGKPDLVDADTVFQLASVSKPLGSTVVAGLVSDKVVTWDDRIIDHDPGFQMHDPYVTAALTIRDTYSHRSGLPEHVGDLLEDMGYDRAEVLRRLRFVPTKNNFRSHYAYTNFGLTEGAVAAADAAGKSWEEISQERLYKRLGMNSTSSRLSDFLAHTNRARGHVLIDGKWVAKYQRAPDAQSPAGGASSSVQDMARWMRLHLNGGTLDGEPIMAAKALAETYRPHMVSDPLPRPATERYGFYGLGWNVGYDELGRVRLSHSGAFELGAATMVVLLPADQLGIVVLTNAQPLGAAEAVGQSFLDLATYGKVQQDWFAFLQPIFEALAKEGRSPIDYSKAPASRLPALANDFYVGAYANDFYGNLDIVVQDGKLMMRQGPKRLAYLLRHYTRDTFYYDTVGESAVGLSGVTFTMGADGRAIHVVVENLNKDGLGMFTRIPGK
ncbi:MAG TPA: serine hydrolase [Nitrospiraceae bacterium]|nr:serine hydrolase [Nitrospiraceae bacterium]